MWADSSTNTITDRYRKKGKKKRKKNVECLVLHVTCHLSLTPTKTASVPPYANSPNMHSRLVRKDQKIQKKIKKGKIIEPTKIR